jgi:hypothetical protein
MAAGLGFKTFTTGEVLTAGDVNGYLMQGINVFTNATARDAAITSPEEGQFAFLKDTNVTTYYTGSAWANVDTTGMTNPMTTTGDVIYSSSGSTPARLGIGTAGQVLQVNSGATAPEWGAAASGSLTKITSATFTAVANTSTTFDDVFTSTYRNYLIEMSPLTASSQLDVYFQIRKAGPTTQATAYFGNTLTNATVSAQTNVNQITLMTLTTESSAVTMHLHRAGTPVSWTYTGYQRPSSNSITGAAMNDLVGANLATGFILTAASGTISGTVAVYGLEN